jgi:hypothetical protein
MVSRLRNCTPVVGNCRSPQSSIARNETVTELQLFSGLWFTRLFSFANSSPAIKIFQPAFKPRPAAQIPIDRTKPEQTIEALALTAFYFVDLPSTQFQEALMRLSTLIFPPISLALNRGFSLKNQVEQQVSLSATTRIYPQN